MSDLFDKEIISDTIAFLAGMEEAQNYPRLAIRSVGDPGHVSSCEYYSYEKYGVYLEMTGDIIFDNSIFDRNKGFNIVMEKRINDSIPQWADSIGIVDSNWLEFNVPVMKEFFELFDFEILNDTTALITLINSRIPHSRFIDLSGLKIKDVRTKKQYDIETMYQGAQFEIKGDHSYRGYMELNFDGCNNPIYICTTKQYQLRLPFTINKE